MAFADFEDRLLAEVKPEQQLLLRVAARIVLHDVGMSEHPVCRLLIGHDEGVVCPVLLFRTGPRRWMSSGSTGHSASSGAGSSATAPPSSGGAARRRGTHEVARVGEQDLRARQLRVLAFAEDAEIR